MCKKLFEEISRRSMSSTEEGIACCPCSPFSAEAEIAAEYRGQPVFFYGRWVDAAPCDLDLKATAESLYDVIVRLENSEGNTDALTKELDRRKALIVSPQSEDENLFESVFISVKELLKNELLKNNIDPDEVGAFDEEFA